jgi:hypothetical protein
MLAMTLYVILLIATWYELQNEQNRCLIESLVENQSYNYLMIKTVIDTNKLLKRQFCPIPPNSTQP